MRRLILAGLIGLVLVGPVQAQTKFVGDDTIREYRAWSLTQKVSYLSGFTGLARLIGLECREMVTVGELMAALDYRAFDGKMQLSDAIFHILLARGCEVRGTVPLKPGS